MAAPAAPSPAHPGSGGDALQGLLGCVEAAGSAGLAAMHTPLLHGVLTALLSTCSKHEAAIAELRDLSADQQLEARVSGMDARLAAQCAELQRRLEAADAANAAMQTRLCRAERACGELAELLASVAPQEGAAGGSAAAVDALQRRVESLERQLAAALPTLAQLDQQLRAAPAAPEIAALLELPAALAPHLGSAAGRRELLLSRPCFRALGTRLDRLDSVVSALAAEAVQRAAVSPPLDPPGSPPPQGPPAQRALPGAGQALGTPSIARAPQPLSAPPRARPWTPAQGRTPSPPLSPCRAAASPLGLLPLPQLPPPPPPPAPALLFGVSPPRPGRHPHRCRSQSPVRAAPAGARWHPAPELGSRGGGVPELGVDAVDAHQGAPAAAVTRVSRNSPAALAGLRQGDSVLRLAGIQTPTAVALRAAAQLAAQQGAAELVFLPLAGREAVTVQVVFESPPLR
eukprot:TRINITY_DN31445_c0_g1_i1.p2 TRINITY_DN31445_c0_g1~~TRINITY_DN31445_c0_g1_i1.p2  ORF type:complete len:479 (+),score=143.50 TRINITY_DN31445_c0_g1_i1:61-1437(+)